MCPEDSYSTMISGKPRCGPRPSLAALKSKLVSFELQGFLEGDNQPLSFFYH